MPHALVVVGTHASLGRELHRLLARAKGVPAEHPAAVLPHPKSHTCSPDPFSAAKHYMDEAGALRARHPDRCSSLRRIGSLTHAPAIRCAGRVIRVGEVLRLGVAPIFWHAHLQIEDASTGYFSGH